MIQVTQHYYSYNCLSKSVEIGPNLRKTYLGLNVGIEMTKHHAAFSSQCIPSLLGNIGTK